MRRTLRFIWPVSEGHLYREQQHLVALGWASATDEQAGQRTRKRYCITDEGRHALSAWLATPTQAPSLQIEGPLRAFYAGFGSPGDLEESARHTAAEVRSLRTELTAFAREYLEPGGPMDLLEAKAGLTAETRREFRGRTVYPDRLPSVALALDVATAVFELLETTFESLADEATTWSSTSSSTLAEVTRARLERSLTRLSPAT